MSINNRFFYISICAGFIIWILIFIVLPVETQSSISLKTISFVFANYMAIIAGFSIFKFHRIKQSVTQTLKTRNLIIVLAFILVLSFVLRYVDLLVLRDLSFSNTIKRNRYFSYENAENANLLFSAMSVIKSLYFFPIIIYIASKSKDKLLLVLSIVLILCPIPEAILLGTRKPFLELILLFVITTSYFGNTRFKKLRIPIIITLTAALFLISGSILFKRVNEYVEENNTSTHAAILDAKYNKFLKPNKSITSYINDENKPDLSKNVLIMAVHFGQYYTHGLFELDYLIKNSNKTTYGAYTFNSLTKFTNKIGLTDIDLKKASEASPRKIVYLTTFGGLYIDFKWVTVLVLFLLGVFQKYVSVKAEKSFIWKPLFFYLLIINVFLCVLNYMRGSGIYPIIGFFIILSLLKLFHSKLNEKSPST